MSKERNIDIVKIKKALSRIQLQIDKISLEISQADMSSSIENTGNSIVGVFDGRFMRVDDDQMFLVPENYASKSKLVVGDKLKLTFDESGKHIYKLIEPIKRTNAVGILNRMGDNYQVKIAEKMFNVLKASVTYFKLKDGSKVSVILPQGIESNWATIENKII